MNSHISIPSASVLWFTLSLQTAAADENSWQLANLFTPSPAQIEREHKGHVMIYNGIKDVDIDRAMDEQFDRIESMMFTGTIVTDDAGQPLRDPETGELVIEDDDC